MTYEEEKEAARQEAIEWQATYNDHNYSLEELADWQIHFEKLAKRYGLTEEFLENGII